MKNNKLTIGVLLAAAIILGIALRVTFYGISCAHVPAFDDECRVALQAKQIARGDLPLLNPGSPYIYPLDTYLMAPFINILPRNAYGTRLLALGYCLLAMIFSILILRRWGRWREVWPGLVLVLFGSGYLLTLQVGCALSGYGILVLIASAVVWMSQRRADHSRPWITALIVGLVGGLACSETMLSLPVLVAGGAMMILSKRWRTTLWTLPALTTGALIGLIPHVLATRMSADAFHTVQQSVSLSAGYHRLLSPALDRTLPAALGIGIPVFPDTKDRISTLNDYGLWFGVLWLLILSTATLVVLIRALHRLKKERWPSVDGGMALAGISWMCLALFLFSARSHSHTYRYFVLIVWSFPFLMAYLYLNAGRALRVLVGMVTLLFVTMNIWNTTTLMARWAKPGFATYLKMYDLNPVIRYLDERGINRCYATYADAYRITFETDERIISCQPYNERFAGWHVPYKEDIVDPSTNVAYVLSDTYRFPPGPFEEDLAAMKVTSRKETCGRYEVYTDFRSAFPADDKVVPQTLLKVQASHNTAAAGRMIDGNRTTFWRSNGALQQTGMWVSVEWDAPQTVRRLRIDQGTSIHDHADALIVHYLSNGKWETLPGVVSGRPGPFEFRNQHPIYGRAIVDIDLPQPLETLGVKIEISKPRSRYAWTIAEIEVIE